MDLPRFRRRRGSEAAGCRWRGRREGLKAVTDKAVIQVDGSRPPADPQYLVCVLTRHRQRPTQRSHGLFNIFPSRRRGTIS